MPWLLWAAQLPLCSPSHAARSFLGLPVCMHTGLRVQVMLSAPPTNSLLFALLFESVRATLTCQKQEERKDLTVWARGIRQTTSLSQWTKKAKILQGEWLGNNFNISRQWGPEAFAAGWFSIEQLWRWGCGNTWSRVPGMSTPVPGCGDPAPGHPAPRCCWTEPALETLWGGLTSFINSRENSVLPQIERFFIIASLARLENRQINLNEMGILFCFCNSLPCWNQ